VFLLGSTVIAKLAVSAANFAIDRPYSYIVPPPLTESIRRGMRVSVPFGRGNRRCEGLVLSIETGSHLPELKLIDALLDDTPVLSEEQLRLALWMRDRFFCTVYDAARAMLPAGMWLKNGVKRVNDKTLSTAVLAIPADEALILSGQKKLRAPAQSEVLRLLSELGSASVSEICYFTGTTRAAVKALEKQGFVTIEEREVFRRPEVVSSASAGELVLNAEQSRVYKELSAVIESEKAEASLLYGVTGSGKTAIYIKLIQKVLEGGKTAIVLVPEIALTPQLVSIFSSYFGDDVAVLHSSLGIGERYDEWKRIRNGSVHVVVGTRSAVFAPVSNLGLIVLDEEQEHTYKSESSPRYHARDIAKYRCASSGALLLLGSATPSLETMYNAKNGRYSLFHLSSRYNKTELPPVIIADMRAELKNGNGGDISSVLRREIAENLERGEQSILFINRRGANSLVACGECGYTFECPHCSVSMTYHSANRRLMCHYCGYSSSVSDFCPDCGGKLKYIGSGTQKIETELDKLFPGIGIVRMDADTVGAVRSHEKLLTRFREDKLPILLGTQMVTKGLDIENVTLVGVISADKSLYMNDFRAHERTFSMLTQVVGRSGRGSKPGRAVIQTFTPNNEVIRLAAIQDYDGFYERELRLRSLIGCPPLNDMFTVTVSGPAEDVVLKACNKVRSALEGYLAGLQDIQILGPAPAHITRVNNRYRYRIILFCQNTKQIRDTLAHIVREVSRDKQLKSVNAFANYNPLD